MRAHLAFAALAVALSARAALAQSPWSLELNGDAAFPTRTLAGADLRTGGGFGVNARYRVLEHLAVYAGWDWHLQQTRQLVVGQTIDANDTGYSVGLRFEHPLRGERLGAGIPAVWLRAGALAAHIELENAAGTLVEDTGHGLGWEAGAGLSVPLGARLALTPGVRYRSLTRDLTLGGAPRTATLAYTTAGIGLAYTFR